MELLPCPFFLWYINCKLMQNQHSSFNGNTSHATVVSAPYLTVSLTHGSDVLRNNADWLPKVSPFPSRLLKTFEWKYFDTIPFQMNHFFCRFPKLHTVIYIIRSKKNESTSCSLTGAPLAQGHIEWSGHSS